jgi:zinc finger-containing ubiquitin peptidase 1
MPSWLVKLLQEEDGALKTTNQIDSDGKLRKIKICPNMQAGVIPVLEQLLDQDVYTEYAYLCDPAVRHVSKLRREGEPFIPDFRLFC